MTFLKEQNIFSASFYRSNLWLFVILLSAAVIIGVSLSNQAPLYQYYTLKDPATAVNTPYPFTLKPFEMPKSGLHFWDWLYLCACYLLVMLYGQALFRPFWTVWGTNNHLARIVCPFFAGYIATIGFSRLLSLMIDARKLWLVTLAVMALTILAGCLKKSAAVDSHTPESSSSKTWLWLSAALLFVAAALALQVYQVDFIWHSHFGEPTIEMLDGIIKSAATFFPISFNYYDSALFHYVITYPIAEKIHVILPWWLTLAIVKLSVFIFIYAIFRRLGGTQILSLASTLFLFFGTVSPIITRYYLLFDYGNPLLLDMDSSRMVALAAFFFVVLTVAEQQIKIGLTALLLFSVGISSLVTSHVAWILLAWLCSWFFAGKADVSASLSLYLDRFICTSTVIAWTLLFALPFDGYYKLRLFACVIPIAAWTVRYAINRGYFAVRMNRSTLSALVAITATGSGLLFLGNLFINNPLSKKIYAFLNRAPEIYGLQWATKVYDGNYVLGDYRDFSRMDLHAQFTSGAAGFLCFYGGILLMILLCQHWTQQRWKSSAPERTAAILHEFFLITVIVLPILFFFMNFINIGEYAWYKIRFTQIPIIYIQFYFLYTISRLDCMGHKFFRTIAASILLLLCLIPFLATQRPLQMLENLRVIKAVFW